jgi:hypothetical protein
LVVVLIMTGPVAVASVIEQTRAVSGSRLAVTMTFATGAPDALVTLPEMTGRRETTIAVIGTGALSPPPPLTVDDAHVAANGVPGGGTTATM